MSDGGSQIDIPASFVALWCDTRGRLQTTKAHLATRYEICEDLANHLTEHCRNVHIDIGADALDVLQRCHRGLVNPESGVSPAEAHWTVTRLAELLNWPAPSWPDARPGTHPDGEAPGSF